MTVIEPDWGQIDPGVRALSTTRRVGTSQDAWASFNLGARCGDDAGHVAENRNLLGRMLPTGPCWLNQVHGKRVIHLDDWHEGIEADAAWTDQPGQVAVVQTADCLPILLADRGGHCVAAVHAGWRGLAAGIIASTLDALPVPGNELVAWIGPAICGRCYQVGEEVRAAFTALDPGLEQAFAPDGARWRADLKRIAAVQLAAAGVAVFDSDRCTFEESDKFYSFRRDGQTGRMASVIWLVG